MSSRLILLSFFVFSVGLLASANQDATENPTFLTSPANSLEADSPRFVAADGTPLEPGRAWGIESFRLHLSVKDITGAIGTPTSTRPGERVVEVSIQKQNPDAKIYYRLKQEMSPTPIETTVNSSGSFKVVLREPTTVIYFSSLDRSTTRSFFVRLLHPQVVVVSAPEPTPTKVPIKKIEKVVKKTNLASLSAGMSMTSILYQEQRSPDYSALATTFRLSYRHRVGFSRWTLGLSTFFTGFNLSKTDGMTPARFVGINFRVSYLIEAMPEPWSLAISTGIYSSSVLVSDKSFGFQGLSGPQFYATLSRKMGPVQTAALYLKAAYVSPGIAFPEFSNHEYAVGGSWSWLMPNQKNLGVTFDYSKMAILVSTLTIESRTFSLGMSYDIF